MLSLIGERYNELLTKTEKSSPMVKLIIIWLSGMALCIPFFDGLNLKLGMFGMLIAYLIMGLIMGFIFNFAASFFWYAYISIAKGKTTLAQTRTISLLSYIPVWIIIIMNKKIEFLVNTFQISGDLEKLLILAQSGATIGLLLYTIYLLYKGGTDYAKADKFWFGIVSIIFSPIIFIIFYAIFSIAAFVSMSAMY
ncbi:MAG: hypothetical protein N4A38_01295 [Candidatus Gracilibacteria bacterium]|nr:hypothetical protein [Candidatus Gracilibacteria bacterium]